MAKKARRLDRKAFCEGLRRSTWKRQALLAEKGLKKVEARLHRLTFSASLQYPDFKDRFPSGLYDDSSNNFLSDRYGKKFICRGFRDFNLLIFTNPIGIRAPYYFQLVPTKDIPIFQHKDALCAIAQALPRLKVSSVEYAVDQYTKDSWTAQHLFWLEVRTLYSPYQRKIWFSGGQGTALGVSKRRNLVYHIGDSDKSYERGEDHLKQEEGWWADAINRVRLEHTANRAELKKHGIDLLEDLIRHPKFAEINKDKWQFKRFTSKTLPCPWDPYLQGAFMAELFKWRQIKKNVAQYLIDEKNMNPILYEVLGAMGDFDRAWASI